MPHTEPQLERRGERPYVAIPIQVPMKEWSKANALVDEVFAWVGKNGIEMAGALFYRYWVVGDMEKPWHLEVGLPVRRRVEGDGRVIAGSMPAGTYARAVHQGHPDSMFQTHKALQAWVKEQRGLDFATELRQGDTVWLGRFDSFLTHPQVEPDPNNWSTEIAYLVREKA